MRLEIKCEIIWASVHIKGNPTLYFGAFYRAHSGTSSLDNQCLSELDQSISRLPKNCQIMLAGDFNLPDVDWTKSYFKPGGRYPAISKKLINITQDLNLHQIVTSPTREDNILDLVFTNVPLLIQNVSIIPGLADHDIVSVEILTSPSRIRQPRRKVFLYKKGKFDLIGEELIQYYSSITIDVLDCLSVNQLWTGFKHVLISAMEKHIPS